MTLGFGPAHAHIIAAYPEWTTLTLGRGTLGSIVALLRKSDILAYGQDALVIVMMPAPDGSVTVVESIRAALPHAAMDAFNARLSGAMLNA